MSETFVHLSKRKIESGVNACAHSGGKYKGRSTLRIFLILYIRKMYKDHRTFEFFLFSKQKERKYPFW